MAGLTKHNQKQIERGRGIDGDRKRADRGPGQFPLAVADPRPRAADSVGHSRREQLRVAVCRRQHRGEGSGQGQRVEFAELVEGRRGEARGLGLRDGRQRGLRGRGRRLTMRVRVCVFVFAAGAGGCRRRLRVWLCVRVWRRHGSCEEHGKLTRAHADQGKSVVLRVRVRVLAVNVAVDIARVSGRKFELDGGHEGHGRRGKNELIRIVAWARGGEHGGRGGHDGSLDRSSGGGRSGGRRGQGRRQHGQGQRHSGQRSRRRRGHERSALWRDDGGQRGARAAVHRLAVAVAVQDLSPSAIAAARARVFAFRLGCLSPGLEFDPLWRAAHIVLDSHGQRGNSTSSTVSVFARGQHNRGHWLRDGARGHENGRRRVCVRVLTIRLRRRRRGRGQEHGHLHGRHHRRTELRAELRAKTGTKHERHWHPGHRHLPAHTHTVLVRANNMLTLMATAVNAVHSQKCLSKIATNRDELVQ